MLQGPSPGAPGLPQIGDGGGNDGGCTPPCAFKMKAEARGRIASRHAAKKTALATAMPLQLPTLLGDQATSTGSHRKGHRHKGFSFLKVCELYDAFRHFDRLGRRCISRRDFIESLADDLPLPTLRAIRQLRLHARFRCSAADVPLDEFLLLVWPNLKEAELKEVNYWCNLREVQWFLCSDQFRGDQADMRVLFNLLDHRGDGSVPLRDIRTAGIPCFAELQSDADLANEAEEELSFTEFCSKAQQRLKELYGKDETVNVDQHESAKAMARRMTAHTGFFA